MEQNTTFSLLLTLNSMQYPASSTGNMIYPKNTTDYKLYQTGFQPTCPGMHAVAVSWWNDS